MAARRTAARDDADIIGQQDTNLFGGSFTPFRDLWNTVAGDLGITTKRMRNDALARAADEEATWRDTSSALTTELERQRALAVSPEDVSQLAALDAQLGIADRLRKSGNPKFKEAGLAMLGKITDEQRAYEERQEVQGIARQAREDTIRKEVGEQGWTRMQGIADDLRQESSSFLKQRDAWGTVNATLAQPPSAASDLSLIFTFMKVLDPDSVVREGEFATAQNAGGVPTLLLTSYNNLLRDGQRLTPEQRKGFYEQARSMYNSASELQRERNGRYLERARAGDVPEKYFDSLTIPVDLAAGPVDFGPDGSAQPPAVQDPQNDSRAQMIGSSIATGVRTAIGNAADLMGSYTQGLYGLGGPSEPTGGGQGGPNDDLPNTEPLYRLRNFGRRISRASEARRRETND